MLEFDGNGRTKTILMQVTEDTDTSAVAQELAAQLDKLKL